MDIEDYREFCISKPGVSEDFPFDNNTLVFKVGGKMFSLLNIEKFESVNLKCDPEIAVQLREKYDDVRPGYHMSKKHWNTVVINSKVSDKLIFDWTSDSYQLVLKSLPIKMQKEILNTSE